jgi:hypothetical protein
LKSRRILDMGGARATDPTDRRGYRRTIDETENDSGSATKPAVFMQHSPQWTAAPSGSGSPCTSTAETRRQNLSTEFQRMENNTDDKGGGDATMPIFGWD